MLAGDDITMSDGVITRSTDSAIRYEASTGDITVGEVDAGSATIAMLAPQGFILDLDDADAVDFTAAGLLLFANESIGAATNLLETQVGVLTAYSANIGIYISETDALEVSEVDVFVNRVNLEGSLETEMVEVTQSDLVALSDQPDTQKTLPFQQA